VTDAFGDAPEDPSQVFELLVLHLLQEEAEKVVFKVLLLDIDRSVAEDLFGCFLVAALWLLDNLSSNQCVLKAAQIVVES
jgi:hypothetical protein